MTQNVNSLLILTVMLAAKSDNRASETEYEIDQIVQKKSALLQDLITEDREYEEKRLALVRDLADLETCEVILRYEVLRNRLHSVYTETFREKIILKKKQELSERNNIFEANHSKVRSRQLSFLLSVVVASKAETPDGV